MKDYQNIILNRLLDKHQGGERGFEAEDSKQTKIRIDVWKDKTLPEYMAEDSYKYRDDIDQAAKSLERMAWFSSTGTGRQNFYTISSLTKAKRN